ncbi:MAG: hypothetical protein ACPLWC_03165, partial [Candidatus Woesearchaeota archaeon]
FKDEKLEKLFVLSYLFSTEVRKLIGEPIVGVIVKDILDETQAPYKSRNEKLPTVYCGSEKRILIPGDKYNIINIDEF